MWSLLKDFQNVSSETEAWIFAIAWIFIGFAIAIIVIVIIISLPKNRRDTYFHGQIDAIRGIIKWKLERNKDGEEVWTEIDKDA
jgi:type IV secretory pathway component VirB8